MNRSGSVGELKFDNETTSEQTLAFADLRYVNRDWVVTAGASMTRLNYFNRNFLNEESADLDRNVIFDPAFSPRVSILKRFKNLRIPAWKRKLGFSAPTLWEVVSANGGLNDSLKPEVGINYELGVKGQPLRRFSYDVTAYVMQMRNTIVPRTEDNGIEYFENSGYTNQNGVEALLSYSFIDSRKHPAWTRAQVQAAYALQFYKFGSYISDGDTLSGNFLPGVPKHSVAADIQFAWAIGVYFDVRI